MNDTWFFFSNGEKSFAPWMEIKSRKINIHEGHAHFFAQGWSWVSRRQELGNFGRFIIDDVGNKISLLRLKSEVEDL